MAPKHGLACPHPHALLPLPHPSRRLRAWAAPRGHAHASLEAVSPQQEHSLGPLQSDRSDSSWQPVSRSKPRRCLVHDHHQHLVPYHKAWQWQKDQVAHMTALPRTPDPHMHLSSSLLPVSQPPTSTASSNQHPSSAGISHSSSMDITGHNSAARGHGSNQQPSSTGTSSPEAPGDHNGGTDSVIILQHPPVYTLGAGSTEANLLFSPGGGAAGEQTIPVVRTERGGEVTYHGPGQLVLYPLLDLAHHCQDLHWYMRGLEEVVIRALWEVSGIQGERLPGLTGVWVGGEKVAAIGVRAKRWVTYHGLALNVCPDLTPFEHIIPCGIKDKSVTSVMALLQRANQGFTGVPGVPYLQGVQGGSAYQGVQGGSAVSGDDERQQLLDEYSFALLDAFAEVFDLQLEPVAGSSPGLTPDS